MSHKRIPETPTSETQLRKVKAIYTGRVQGVGFRMTVRDLAVQFPVHGRVCNVVDGTVEMVAVGTSEALSSFLAAIDGRMSRNIENCLLDWGNAQEGEFTDFAIGPDKWGI